MNATRRHLGNILVSRDNIAAYDFRISTCFYSYGEQSGSMAAHPNAGNAVTEGLTVALQQLDASRELHVEQIFYSFKIVMLGISVETH